MPQGFCADCGGNDGDNDRGGIPESDEKLGRGRMKDNPLDTCSGRFMACHNPCGHGPENKASCETLPSQIENFQLQFFGDVIKTEVNGQVQWSLPCSLTVGLPNNPRGATEPLACYFLRLFNDGVTGINGPQGAPGVAGIDGHNAFTFTTQGFSQPPLNNPQIHISTQFNPVFLEDLVIFIDGSGWYRIDQANPDGTLFVTLISALAGAPSFIPAGSLVVPSGAPGANIIGPQGPQGLQGPKGDTGDQGPPSPTSGVTNTNGQYHDGAGTNFVHAANVWADVLFVSSNPQILLPNIGTYLINAVIAMSPTNAPTPVFGRLYNITEGADLVEFRQGIAGERLVPVTAIINTIGVNETVGLQAFGDGTVYPAFTTITYVQIA